MIDEKLVIEKFQLLKKNIMKKHYIRYKPEHICMMCDEFIKYINKIKVEE